MATVITTTGSATATAYSNQRKVARTSNGVLWTIWDDNTKYAKLYYSTDDGATWTAAPQLELTSGTPGGEPTLSFFIDADDYAHVIYVNPNSLYLTYRRGTPNAARTAWTWSTALQLQSNPEFAYPDLIAHREGTGWVVHYVMSYAVSGGDSVFYNRITISSTGGLTHSSAENQTIGASTYQNTNHKWPSIDFHHTGDGKTVAGGTPHIYVAWSAGTYGAGKGIRFRKATYSGGSWTWNAEREIDSTRYYSGLMNCMFDGTRVVIAGQLWNGTTNSLMLYERDVADTTTTTRTLIANQNADLSTILQSGSSTYDSNNGDVYFAGADRTGSTNARKINTRKWTRSTTTLEPIVTIDSTGAEDPYVSFKRGGSNTRAEFIYIDGSASPYNITYHSILLNQPPNAPSGLSPANNLVIDRDATQRFSWNFSDPDAGDTQSNADIRYRVAGTSTWTNVLSVGGVNSYHDFPAGTFAAGDYEWQVRTYDAQGVVGPYSASAFFTAASTPATPAITDPVNGQTIPTETYTVRWSASVQTHYQVRTVADNAGSPDATTVYEDTDIVSSTTARSRTMAFATNNRAEHVQVRIQANGLWSAWASVAVTVSFTPPQNPRLTATPNDALGTVDIDADIPPDPPGLPTFTRASTAHLDGAQVASGVPRYPYGRNLLDLARSEGVDGWYQNNSTQMGVVRGSTDAAWSGDSSVRMNRNAGEGTGELSLYSAVAYVIAGATHSFSFYVLTQATRDVRAVIAWSNGATTSNTVSVPAGVWTRITVTATVPAGVTWARGMPAALNIPEGEYVWFDGFQQEAGPLTPWRPGGPSAILIEEGTTNVLPHANASSFETDTSGWSAVVNCTIARSTAFAWHGAASLAITASAAGDMRAQTIDIAVSASTAYTASIYVRPGSTARQVHVDLLWYTSSGVYITENLSAAVMEVAGVWTRIPFTVTSPSTAAFARVRVRILNAAASEVHYVDGVQVEAKGHATSWHPGGATRNAETLYPPTPVVPIEEGTVEFDIIIPPGGDAPATSDSRFLLDARGGTNQQPIYLYWSVGANSVLTGTVAGSGTTGVLYSSLADGEVHRVAMRWRVGESHGRLYVDGAQVGTAAMPTNTPAFTTVGIGSRSSGGGGTGQVDNPIVAVRFTKRMRTEAELADWTAPLEADDDTTYLLKFEGNLEYETEYGEFVGGEDYPTVTSYDVYRRKVGETAWSPRASGVAPSTDWIDYEAAAKTNYEYKLVSHADNSTSSESALVTAAVEPTDWRLRDPADHSRDILIEVEMDSFGVQTPKDIAFFNPLGRNFKVAVEDVIRGDEFSLIMGVINGSDYEALKSLVKSQRTLFVQSPIIGEAWYVRVQGPLDREVINTNDPYAKLNVKFIEVDAPNVSS